MAEHWPSFVLSRLPELLERLGEHLALTGFSTGLGIALALPLALLAGRRPWLRSPLLGASGILQTVPSLAMLAILLALFHRIGTLPAVVALTLYAILPILRNTLAGLDGTPPEAAEAARAMGMTETQLLFKVKLPLALPVLLAGVRTAAVLGVGIATLSAFVGAGGLGQFINRGLALSDSRLILLGAVPAALLALLVDAALAALERGLRPLRGPKKSRRRAPRLALASLPLLCLAAAGWLLRPAAPLAAAPGGKAPIRVGSKDFTEQYILAELMARIMEAEGIHVERRFGLGGTAICHEALRRGEIDVYAEYTGTALTAVLKRKAESGERKVFEKVAEAYRSLYGLAWLAPFGFNNTYALAVRAADAKRRGWRRISDLSRVAHGMKAGFTGEFAERPDGYPGLAKRYGLVFGEVKDMDPTLLYQAAQRGQVDLISAFSTDGRIESRGLVVLGDDKGYFPPYQAAPVVREALLLERPELGRALSHLAGALNDGSMRRLNSRVDEGREAYESVAGSFLASRKAEP